jgi:hypothetical protein
MDDPDLILEARRRGLTVRERLSERARRKLIRRMRNDDLVDEAQFWHATAHKVDGKPVDRVAVRVIFEVTSKTKKASRQPQP